MLMFPTSLPGGMPGGMTAARPTSPRRASLASVGIAAASSGVRPPSAAIGSSAHPSGTHTTYFIERSLRSSTSSLVHCGRRHELFHAHEVVRQGDEPLGPLEEVGEVRRQ